MKEAIGDATAVGRPGRGRRPAARESILDAIRASEPLSRVELAAITGLTEAAVSMTVRRLLDEGLVVETGRAPTGGKPRTLLRLDPAARLAVGVHLDRDVTTFVLTGQTGGVISRLARPAPPGDLLPHLADGIGTLLAASGVVRARCLGLGVVWPGPRNGNVRRTPGADIPAAEGRVPGLPDISHFSGPGAPSVSLSTEALPHASDDAARLRGWDAPPHLRGWDADELGRQLAEENGWPVLVENDATAAAVGEYWVARVGPEQAFAALYMGSGIGAGIVVEGRAMRGGHGAAGEFGHVCVQVDGPECWCGSRGCLEVLAGPRTVVAAARADGTAAAEAGLGQSAPRSVTADFAAVARAARAGAPRCLALLEDSARYVAAAAESVVNLLDIDLVVLTGPGFAAASFVYGPAIMRRVQPADHRTWHRSATVTVSLAAATASATGAAALVLQSHLRR
ncbi:sugar kinase [Actinoplanes lobatus]|uniref:Sugar kinase n=1 Tax=Actinoplanes lobatus TaxID=113568 RepID=A0A7W7MIB0_9ACTN|nr:ROK family transcriptional regulator [Actinoplanes lobatus]MBB4751309.1 putative NBD/HSP70 family sugar kinase [Actinoplanes lobatus]GGN63442.1 sugar kinase [Actinoplanes lobatus]GIE44749.1 sugar kinase [Actinoplanes lobatus]